MGAGAATAVAIGATVASAAGTAISAMGSINQGNYSAQVARNNAQIAQQSATYSAQAGLAQGQQQSLQNAAQLGQIKANQAANNIDTNSGSALDVQEGQEAAGALDTQTTVHNALLQAYGYQTQEESQEAQASQDQASGIEGATSDILSGASSIGFKFGGNALGSVFSGTSGDGSTDGGLTQSDLNTDTDEAP
jgi:hypothetical protein